MIRIKPHLEASVNVLNAVKSLKSIIDSMPESKEKYKLQARVEIMEEVSQRHLSQSGDLYDHILSFSQSVSL